MLRNFILREQDAENDPQGGSSSGKTRASDLRAQLGANVDEQALTRLLEKHADLLNDNSQLREQRRNLKQEITDLKSKAAPEGSRVLSAEDADAYEAYRALNLAPADVQAALAERDTIKGELATRQRTDLISAAAAAHGYKLSALSKLPSLQGKEIIVEDATVDGKPVKRALVATDGKRVSLPDYIQANDAEFLPALAEATPTPRGDGVGSPAAGGKRPQGGAEMRSPGITI